MSRRLRHWLRALWRGWEYREVGGVWMLVATRPLTVRRLAAARRDAAVMLRELNRTEQFFQSVRVGRTSFAERAERLPDAPPYQIISDRCGPGKPWVNWNALREREPDGR